jgi:glycine/D-amino acid oxidase-like deaminating enzyme
MIVASATTTRSPRAELLAPPLTGGARVEICIIGAGVAGMVAAYLLAREKRSVMVLDEGPIGGVGATGDAVALAGSIEPPYPRPGAAAVDSGAARSHAEAIDTLEAIVRRERIACDFERLDGYVLPLADTPLEELEREVDAARQHGIDGAELVRGSPMLGGPERPCLRYPGQATFHPARFLSGLARAITREGGRIHCGVKIRQTATARPAWVETLAGHRIEAEALVMPVAQRSRTHATMIALRVPRGSIARGLYWDADGGRCARLRSHGTPSGEVLVVGAEGDDPSSAAAVLESWARERFPRAGEVLQRISGELPAADDLFAFRGDGAGDADGTYVTAASWGAGVTRGAIAGLMIRDFVTRPRHFS